MPTCLRCFMKPVSSCILIPEAPGRLAWDVLVALMIVYYLIMVPLRLAFDETNPTSNAIQSTGSRSQSIHWTQRSPLIISTGRIGSLLFCVSLALGRPFFVFVCMDFLNFSRKRLLFPLLILLLLVLLVLL